MPFSLVDMCRFFRGTSCLHHQSRWIYQPQWCRQTFNLKYCISTSCKSIITPIWTYSIELWGCSCKSNIAVIQRCQTKIIRAIVDAPMVCHQWHDPQRPRYSHCKRSHPWHKCQALYKIRIPLEPITPTASTGQRHTKTEKTVASWTVIRWTRFPWWRGHHHTSKSTS
jgi:hypothetical protein